MRIELFKNISNSNVVEEFYDYDDTLVINAGMNTTVLSNKSRVQSSICTSHSRRDPPFALGGHGGKLDVRLYPSRTT